MAVWPIDFCPHQPGPGEGRGPRWASWVPRPQGSPGSPVRVDGVQPGAAAPATSCLPPSLPGPCPSVCPQAARSFLSVQEAGGPSPDSQPPDLRAAARTVFFKNRMDMRKTTTLQNHT